MFLFRCTSLFKSCELNTKMMNGKNIMMIVLILEVILKLISLNELIGKNMFKKETNIHLFDGFKVVMSTPLSTTGAIDGPFGQSGKFKIRLFEPLNEEAKSLLGGGKKKKAEDKVSGSEVVEVRMTFKKYLFTKKVIMVL